MTGKYRVIESVGSTFEDVHDYEDLEKHHPTWPENPNRRHYAEIDGSREEYVSSPGGERMVSKDMVFKVDGDALVDIPSPLEGYVRRSPRLDRWGTVELFDGPGDGARLVARIRHMEPIHVADGDHVQAGEPLGRQGNKAPPGKPMGLHVHMDVAESRLNDFKQYIRDIDTGAITPDSYPALLSSPYNPHNFLYMQTLAGVHQMESARNITPGTHSENLAAALTVGAIRDGLTRVDRVELNDTGSLARAIQVSPVRDEAFLNVTTLAVGTEAASGQSLAWTSEQARQQDEAVRVQQEEQPAMRFAAGLHR